jgi:hypothetical protein
MAPATMMKIKRKMIVPDHVRPWGLRIERSRGIRAEALHFCYSVPELTLPSSAEIDGVMRGSLIDSRGR